MPEESDVERLKDLLDATVILVGQPAYDPERFDYFDDLREYGKALLSIGKDPDITIPHELAHGRCALDVGVIGVRYGIEYEHFDVRGQRLRVPLRAVTSLLGPSKIPYIAHAAIFAAPKDPSPSDLAHIRRRLYPSVEYLKERIVRWNRRDTGLVIPLPGTIDTSYQAS